MENNLSAIDLAHQYKDNENKEIAFLANEFISFHNDQISDDDTNPFNEDVDEYMNREEEFIVNLLELTKDEVY